VGFVHVKRSKIDPGSEHRHSTASGLAWSLESWDRNGVRRTVALGICSVQTEARAGRRRRLKARSLETVFIPFDIRYSIALAVSTAAAHLDENRVMAKGEASTLRSAALTARQSTTYIISAAPIARDTRTWSQGQYLATVLHILSRMMRFVRFYKRPGE